MKFWQATKYEQTKNKHKSKSTNKPLVKNDEKKHAQTSGKKNNEKHARGNTSRVTSNPQKKTGLEQENSRKIKKLWFVVVLF